MTRTAARATTCLGAVLLTVLGSAQVALADNRLGPLEGEEPGRTLSYGATILLYFVVPVAILLVTAALVWLPGMVRAARYRPSRGWNAPPVWFAGPPEPVAAVQDAEPGRLSRGGASGSW